MLLLFHGENLISFVVALYVTAVLVWAAFCYLIIKYWMKRKKQKRAEKAKRD